MKKNLISFMRFITRPVFRFSPGEFFLPQHLFQYQSPPLLDQTGLQEKRGSEAGSVYSVDLWPRIF